MALNFIILTRRTGKQAAAPPNFKVFPERVPLDLDFRHFRISIADLQITVRP